MPTRFSLPTHVPPDETDTARSARTLAALVLAVAVIALMLLAAMVPVAEPELATARDAEPPAAATVTVPGA